MMLTNKFRAVFDRYPWNEVVERIREMKESDVFAALGKRGHGTPEDFMALVSPAAEHLLEAMASASMQLTRKRFGKVMQMYIPLYLSNECQNICTYCGFSFDNRIPRITLDDEQILKEVEVIKKFGFDHVLLVSGEANQTVGTDYFERAARLIRRSFSNVMLEVQPLEIRDYERLIAAGINTVLVYQETYCEDQYHLYHKKGRKSNFDYRLETPDRLGLAGVHRIGLGVLLGLEDWRADSFYTALHLHYLEKNYWKTKYSISFPRLRPAVGCQQPNHPVSDKQLVQLICAYRIFNEHVELSLSTRESPAFRDHVMKLGITSMSAGSKTDPGGYAGKVDALEQFEISDDRSPEAVAAMIAAQGYDPVWKDWDKVF